MDGEKIQNNNLDRLHYADLSLVEEKDRKKMPKKKMDDVTLV
jgi:hypothetical protein